jgi:hypothetical protein
MANNQQLLLGEGAGSAPAVFVEDVFSTYLYTGTGSTQTITNNIDLSTKGGLVWAKRRDTTANHQLADTVRGAFSLVSNQTAAQGAANIGFTSTGFDTPAGGDFNPSGASMASWTFRKQRKFFDVVTYTGDGTSSQTINHNLGASPGCIITKRTDSTGNWTTWHRSFADTKTYIDLNTAAASVNLPSADAMTVSSTSFTVGTNQVFGNGSGFVYVAYLFAHDAGGFGLAGTDNVISCGSFTTDGSGNASVNLGYEPQFWLYKPNLAARYWVIYDTMRGWSQTQIANLNPNRSDAEGGGAATLFYPTATGFDCVGSALDASTQHIYIAIRRGPMKVPTVGTSVFDIVTRTATNPNLFATALNYVDAAFNRNLGSAQTQVSNRLAGPSYLHTASTSAEVTPAAGQIQYDFNYKVNPYWWSLSSEVDWLFQRAPGFFDEVCYTGTGVATTQTHNLGVVPELMIMKCRSGAGAWGVYSQTTGNANFLELQSTNAVASTTVWNSTSPTATVFTVATNFAFINASGSTYVAYLFATCAGVSKVGSYTGNGSSQTIACGFAAGSRFVMIKRTDSTGDWYVWDSARGIIAGNDPHLSLNTTAAEVTTDDSVDTDNSGFIVNQVAATNVNVSSATYIFLAIA